jgi:hypothetical protein
MKSLNKTARAVVYSNENHRLYIALLDQIVITSQGRLNLYCSVSSHFTIKTESAEYLQRMFMHFGRLFCW